MTEDICRNQIIENKLTILDNADIIKKLIDNGADTQLQDKDSNSAYDLANLNSNLKCSFLFCLMTHIIFTNLFHL